MYVNTVKIIIHGIYVCYSIKSKCFLLYVDCVTLIQSFKTGKNHMVDEQAKLIFTISFNLYCPDEWQGEFESIMYYVPQVLNLLITITELSEGAAYPLKDLAVWQYLCEFKIKDVKHDVVHTA